VQKWGVILGDNGFGKTTLLRSIAMGLCDKTGASGLLQDTYGDWVRSGEEKATIKIDLLDGVKKYWIETTIYHERDSKLETVEQVTEPPVDFPWRKIFVCGYGANRSILGSELFEKYSLADSLYTLFNYKQPSQSPELMLRRRAISEEEIEEICRWLDEVLMLDKGSTKLDESGIKIKSIGGRDVYLGSLPDGQVSMMTLVLDMLGWATLKGLKDQNNKMSGIILIDEIEQHLHPSWQKYIIRQLHKVFPNLQFIVTTHSPLCAIGTANLPSADEISSLLVLQQEDDHIKGQDKIQPPRGRRADQVLTSSLFGLETTRSIDTVQRIERYSQLLLKSTLKEEEKNELESLRIQLKDEIGSAETPLQELVEKAVHKAIHELVSEIPTSQKTPPPAAIQLEIRRRLKELFGSGESND
jgi:predicted ATPase